DRSASASSCNRSRAQSRRCARPGCGWRRWARTPCSTGITSTRCTAIRPCASPPSTPWNGFGLPDVARHKCHVLDEHCRRLGRDPGEIERSIGGFNAERIRLLDDYLAAGVTHFIMGVGGPDWDIIQLSKLIAYRDQHNGG